jgi:hypothetical protein
LITLEMLWPQFTFLDVAAVAVLSAMNTHPTNAPMKRKSGILAFMGFLSLV